MPKTERWGTILLLCYAILGGLFPIFGKIGVAAMPPLLFTVKRRSIQLAKMI